MPEQKVSNYLLDNYQDYYQDVDKEWRRLGALDKVNNILDVCAQVPHSTVLEIGAGDGAILQQLDALNFGEKLFAIEIVQNAVERINQLGIPHLAECRLFDGYTIPYPDDFFDLVILSHVVEHLEYPRALLMEAQRVGRHIFIEVPLEDTARLPKDFRFTATGHINAYHGRGIRHLVQSTGLEVLCQTVINPSKDVLVYRYGRRGQLQYWVREIALRIMPRLAQRVFTYHSAILAK
ncbi:MAG: class I SAM-dependent methyltransferase [Anaerolineales bacterium]|nr:class I SAM-dependent methyltransferase [Anaerolineales bacterium]